MTDDDLCFTPATELAVLLRSRELSPVELTKAVLARAERLQPVLNCFITLVPERALAEARRAEEDIAAGRPLGRLHGIPFTVKDLVNTEGVRTTFGAVVHRDNVPAEDAVSVARLRAEGAILIGKTTTPEFGSGPMTNSPLFGSTRNPWDLSRTSGGSSGGAAAATAAGIAPLAVATDGGGSTRIPAACNALVGLKQSNGVVPHSQAQDLFGNQTYVTPLTRTVNDTALMLQVMAGPSALDPWSLGLRAHDYVAAAARQDDLRGKRVLYCLSPSGRPVSRDATECFTSALQTLASLGATLEPFDAGGFDVEPIWRAINHTVWRARFAPLIEKHPDTFSETFKRQIASATSVSGVTIPIVGERPRCFRCAASTASAATTRRTRARWARTRPRAAVLLPEADRRDPVRAARPSSSSPARCRPPYPSLTKNYHYEANWWRRWARAAATSRSRRRSTTSTATRSAWT
jgi:aspartyl-tRNA(Asn)/glutamyl-tRNA(Gln) amidotransferase subunit A